MVMSPALLLLARMLIPFISYLYVVDAKVPSVRAVPLPEYFNMQPPCGANIVNPPSAESEDVILYVPGGQSISP